MQMKAIWRMIILAMFATTLEASAAVIQWLDVTQYIKYEQIVISDEVNHPLLGRIKITTSFIPNGVYSAPAGSLSSLSWEYFAYINHYRPSTGTPTAIDTTLTFEFLDGPIDTSNLPVERLTTTCQ